MVTVSGGTMGADLKAYDNSTVSIIASGFNFDYGDYTDGSLLDAEDLDLPPVLVPVV